MRTIVLSNFLMLFLFLLGGQASAGEFTGTVRSVDPPKGEFTMDGEGPGIDVGDQFYSVRMDESVALYGYNSLKEIKPGDEVNVQGDVLEDGNTVHATAVSQNKAEKSRQYT